MTDLFYTQDRFLAGIDPRFALTAMLELLLTSLGLIGNLARVEKGLVFLEIDALLILIGYLIGMCLLDERRIGF